MDIIVGQKYIGRQDATLGTLIRVVEVDENESQAVFITLTSSSLWSIDYTGRLSIGAIEHYFKPLKIIIKQLEV